MKKSILNGTMLMALAATLMVSCVEGEPNTGGDGLTDDLLKGEITSTITLKEGMTYRLEGGVHVLSGAKLIIEPGVTIIAQSGKNGGNCDYILIEQGGKMEASGTAAKPIVMTSVDKQPGAWGGIHVCGKAPVNFSDASGAAVQAKSEIGDANYGGTMANDNSGIYKYIRLEYTGYSFSADKEANGFTFYGVGNGTVCEYLQAYKGSDDGFEWFGGTVNARYLVSTESEDDSFDWTYGWAGKGQFWVAKQSATVACDCLIEADNSDKFVTAQPRSNPMLANLTLIGYESSAGSRGIRLRAGTAARLYNTLVLGTKKDAVSVETTQTVDWFVSNPSFMQNILATTALKSAAGTESSLDFATLTNVKGAQTIAQTDIVGTVAGGTDVKALDSWFASANYIGAIEANNNWAANWTK